MKEPQHSKSFPPALQSTAVQTFVAQFTTYLTEAGAFMTHSLHSLAGSAVKLDFSPCMRCRE